MSTDALHPSDDAATLIGAALGTLALADAQALEAHVAECPRCARELARLRPLVELLSASPDLAIPPPSLRDRLRSRLAADTGRPPQEAPPPVPRREWEDVGPGISCQVLAEDEQTGMVSLLVHLAPGTDYPPHTHAGVEELHLLGGELWIDDRKLVAGDYNRAEPGSADRRVWSETGCTCVLLTSRDDRLGPPAPEG